MEQHFTPQEIQHAILALPAKDFSRFREWFIEHDHAGWDGLIAEDRMSGKFNNLIAEAKADYKNGKASPL